MAFNGLISEWYPLKDHDETFSTRTHRMWHNGLNHLRQMASIGLVNRLGGNMTFPRGLPSKALQTLAIAWVCGMQPRNWLFLPTKMVLGVLMHHWLIYIHEATGLRLLVTRECSSNVWTVAELRPWPTSFTAEDVLQIFPEHGTVEENNVLRVHQRTYARISWMTIHSFFAFRLMYVAN